MHDEKARETRLRRIAARRGLRLVKSRRRDKDARTSGRYWLMRGNRLVDDLPFRLNGDRDGTTTLEEIERALALPLPKPKRKPARK